MGTLDPVSVVLIGLLIMGFVVFGRLSLQHSNAIQRNAALAMLQKDRNSESILAVSTSMVSRSTMTALENRVLGLGLIYKPWDEYGFIISVLPSLDGQNVDELLCANGMNDLAALYDFARQRGHQYLLLDRDADPLEGFPTFEW